MKRIYGFIGIFVIVIILFLFNVVDYNVLKKSNFSYACINDEEHLRSEINELYNAIDLNKKYDNTYIISKVKYNNIYGFNNKISVYKGRKDGIKKDLAVINDKGLIGITKKVNKYSTEVLLITNKKSKISVKINESYGVLKMNNNSLVVDGITKENTVQKGDIVYTSGIGKLPADIAIGSVIDIKKDDLDIEKILYIKPFVDFNNINFVLVVGEV